MSCRTCDRDLPFRAGRGRQRQYCDRACQRAHPLSVRARWEYVVRHAYGLSPEQAEELLAAGCGICGEQAETIDHDHKTGKVRGGLCHRHNRALGSFDDSPELLELAAEYLRQAT